MVLHLNNDDPNGWKDRDMIAIDLQMVESNDVEFINIMMMA